MKIRNKELKFKITLRAMMIFEQITGKQFSINSMLDEYIYFYSIILANNPDFNLSFDDFIDALDDDPTIIKEMNEKLTEYAKKMGVFPVVGSDDKKKH